MTGKTTNLFSPEVRERAVRMVLDHETEHPSRWAAIVSVSSKIGCTAQTLQQWLGKAEHDSGRKSGLTTDMAATLKTLGRQNRELRQANEILKKASACFASSWSGQLAELTGPKPAKAPPGAGIGQHTVTSPP